VLVDGAGLLLALFVHIHDMAPIRSSAEPTILSPKHRSVSPVVDKAPPTPAAPKEPEPRSPRSPRRSPSVTTSRDPTPAEDDPSEDDADDENDKSDPSQTIDIETFHQILDLDEDDTHDFSKGMAWAYFSQASSTFTEMDEAYSKKDLAKLSSLGHFLKGSSAALGVAKVQASCEQIQHYGQLRDEDTGTDLTDKAALQKIGPLLTRVKAEYAVAETWLRKWYEEHARPDGEGE